jgi:hypothetical protein
MKSATPPNQATTRADNPNGIEIALYLIDEEVGILTLRTTWRRIKNSGRPQAVIFSSMIPTGI